MGPWPGEFIEYGQSPPHESEFFFWPPAGMVVIEYGHEAKPSILGLQIAFLAAPRDYHGDGDCRARLEL